jgi:DNA polymerase-3 subunit epsilon
LVGRCVLDAMQIFHARERRDLNTAVAFYCGRRHDSPHRADHDVLAAAHVLDAQLGRYADLPRTVTGLHTLLAEADLSGRFRLLGGELVFGFGKYVGKRLKDVARDDPGYLEWILAGDFLDDVKELVRTTLKNASAQV